MSSEQSGDEKGNSNTMLLGRHERSRDDSEVPVVPSMKEEFKVWFQLMWPVVLANFCRTGMSFTDTAVLGHRSTDFLAASSIAVVWSNMSMVLIFNGFCQGLSTLCSQSWGAKNKELMGVWLQLTLVCVLVVCIPVGASWWWTGEIMSLFLKIDSTMIRSIDIFQRVYLACIIPFSINACVNQFLLAQSINKPQLVLQIGSLGLNFVFNYAFIYGVPQVGIPALNLRGSALATSTSQWLLLSSQLAVVFWYLGMFKSTWPKGFHSWRNVFRKDRVRKFMGQALPAALFGLLEEWQLQVISIMAGNLGTVEIATHNALFNVIWVLSSLMWGLSDASRIRICHWLGAGSIAGAKQVCWLALYAGCFIGVLVGGSFVVGRHWVGHLYSNDPLVWKQTSEIGLLVGSAYCLLVFFYVSMSALAAQGRPEKIAIAFFIGAWCVSVPLSWYLAFKVDATKGLFGLWLGMSIGYGVTTFISGYFFISSNWQTILKETQERTEKIQNSPPDVAK